MSRSFLRRLNLTDPGSRSFSFLGSPEARSELPSKYMRFDLLTLNPRRKYKHDIKVAVVGGGFAGLAAASVLQNLHVRVTLFEARNQLGGRVETMRGLFKSPHPQRFLERGAELIGSGSSHRAWIRLAKDLGLGLSVITEDEKFEGMDLYPPLRLGGKAIDRAGVKELIEGMEDVLKKLVRLAEAVFLVPPRPSTRTVFEPWYEPWKVPFAEKYDNKTLGSWIRKHTPASLRSALIYSLSNDMAIDIDKLSLLAMLTHIAGGGFSKYWEGREVYRCADGNQTLAEKLAQRLREGCPPADIRLGQIVKVIKVNGKLVQVVSERDNRAEESTHDFLILAVPPTVWGPPNFEVINWQLPQQIQSGPAVKFLATAGSRYWVPKGYAPSGNDDRLGQLWESTDNQSGDRNIGLTVFAGGQYAELVGKNPVERYFKDGIEKLLPGANDKVNGLRSEHAYADWPNEKHIMTGYSAPSAGQVTGVQREMQNARSGRIFLAGEHVSPPYFGFMEGALQSGLKAAERVAIAANIPIPSPPRELPRDTRAAKLHDRLKCAEVRIV